jgi:hypothetical protein
MTSQADACSYCMGSVVLISSQIYLYLQLLWIIDVIAISGVVINGPKLAGTFVTGKCFLSNTYGLTYITHG